MNSNIFSVKAITVFLLLLLAIKLFYLNSTVVNLNVLNYPDEINYYAAGANNFKEQGFKYFFTERSMYNGPCNILWVSLFPNYASNKIANIFLTSLSALLVFSIVAKLYTVRAGALSCLLFSIYPSIQHFSATILTEPLFIFLLLSSFYLIIEAERKNSPILFILTGIIFSLATLTRPTVQYLPFFLLILYLTRSLICKCIDLKKVNKILFFLLGFLLLTAPWVIKNKVLFGKLSIATGSGAVLYLGNDQRKNGDEPFYSQMHFDTYEITKPYSHLDLEGDKLLTKKAISFIKEHPLDFIKLSALKSLKVLFGYPKDYFEGRNNLPSFLNFPNRKVFYGNILELLLHSFLAVVFIFSLFKIRSDDLPLFFAKSLILYFIILHSIIFPIPRLFLPAIAFIICLVPLAFQYFKLGIASFCISLLIVFGIGFYDLKPNEIISDNKQKFYKTTNLEIQETISTKSIEVKDGFYIVRSGSQQELIYKIKSAKTKLNSVYFINVQHLNNNSSADSNLISATISWDENLDFSKQHSYIFLIKPNTTATYMLSPNLAYQEWREGEEIKYLKLSFNFNNKDQFKINYIKLAN